MPIKERTIVDIREEMALRALDERYTVTEVAEMYGYSRPSVRLWRDRYREHGREGLVDRSHAPSSCPHRTDATIEAWIIGDRKRWGFGSKKILNRLQRAFPGRDLPARSTIDAIVARHGLVQKRHSRRGRQEKPFVARYVAKEPGELTTIDFKGEFLLGNGRYCYPLTMVDRISRYLLACEALSSTSFEQTWPVIERILRRYGRPLAMQSDNGPPFGATNGKLSRLTVELMTLDIQPVFSRPGVPQDNGAHERMHRELKAATTLPPERTYAEQQIVFDRFQRMYNIERPHEAIDMDRPAERYPGSARPYPNSRPKPEYEPHWETRKVLPGGEIKWRQKSIFVSHALAGQTVALEATAVDLWTVRFHRFRIGKLDEREGKFI